MKASSYLTSALAGLMLTSLTAVATAQETVKTRIGSLNFTHDFASG